MSDQYQRPGDSGSSEFLSQNAGPAPAPQQQPQPTGDSVAQSVGEMRKDMRAMRWMTLASLVVIVLLALVTAFSVNTTTSRMSDLSGQISALSAQVAAVSAQQMQQQAGESTPVASGTPAPAQTLGPALALTGVSPVPKGVTPAGAIVVGDPNAHDVIEIFVDYQCPYCQQWEKVPGAELYAQAVKPGSGLQIQQYTLAFLGETSPDLNPAGASARAGNAALCVYDADGQDTFVKFSQSVYATANPTEPPGQFPTDQLKQLATDAGASDAALACIEDERFVPYVAATTQAAFTRGVQGTPTVAVNGTQIANAYSDPALDTIIAQQKG